MFDAAAKRDVSEGGRGLLRCKGAGIEFPFVALVVEDELPSLVSGRVDDNKRPEYVRASGCVLVWFEERISV